MFLILGSSSGCQMCDKDKPGFKVKCDRGTMEGPICGGCLSKLVAAREKVKPKPTNGDEIPEALFAER